MKQTSNNNSHFSMTNCTKPGIKIKNNNNDYLTNPFAEIEKNKKMARSSNVVPINLDKTKYEMIDLNIDNYSIEELYNLFGYDLTTSLSEDHLKHAKKIVLKTHPDKSGLNEKYFIFFSVAYEKLKKVSSFQNNIINKNIDNTDYNDDKEKKHLILGLQNELKKTNQFNNWFNEQFDKYKLEDQTENGYDDWLKSSDDIVYTSSNMTKEMIGQEMHNLKKEIQTLLPYKGVGDIVLQSSVGGSTLMVNNNNYSSGTLFSNEGIGYTDLKQAYIESIIPVTEDDYNKIQKFNSVDEYKRHRNNIVDVWDTKNDNKKILQSEFLPSDIQADNDRKESATLAYYYEKQTEKNQLNSSLFWSSLKQLKN